MTNTEKKTHLYAVDVAASCAPSTHFVKAHTKQQAIAAVVERFITAERADGMAVLNAGIDLADVIDARVAPAPAPHPDQQPPGLTAAEELETPQQETHHVDE